MRRKLGHDLLELFVRFIDHDGNLATADEELLKVCLLANRELNATRANIAGVQRIPVLTASCSAFG